MLQALQAGLSGASFWQAGVMDGAATVECMLCRPELADEYFTRLRLWEDEHWRLSAVLQCPFPGFAHLEPRRHIPYTIDLAGPEATSLGGVLARVSRALRDAAGAEKTYVYVFGDHVPHLHFNLAFHRVGDALRVGQVYSTRTNPTRMSPSIAAWQDAALRALA